jgi:tripartite-type tricarboxylate transporter receptor subunit TctC
MTGTRVLHAPHKGGAPALNSLLGGHEQMMFPPVAAPVLSHAKAGRLRALAVTSARPSPLLPDLPTVAASAVPGYEVETKVGIYVPVKTPRAVVTRLNGDLLAILNNPEVQARFAQAAMDVIGSTPEQAALTSRDEFAKIVRVVKDAGIRGK